MADWVDRAPAYLRSHGRWHDGTLLNASVDRMWLWRIEAFLAVNATNDMQRQMAADLRQYLNQSCHHDWRDMEDYDDNQCRQCVWCNWTEWPQADGSWAV